MKYLVTIVRPREWYYELEADSLDEAEDVAIRLLRGRRVRKATYQGSRAYQVDSHYRLSSEEEQARGGEVGQ